MSSSTQESDADITSPVRLSAQPQEVTTITSVRRIHRKNLTASARPASQHDASGVFTKQEDEPLIDTTAALTLHSKKTSRLQKKSQKKQQSSQTPSSSSNPNISHNPTTLLSLPPELLLQILHHLLPTDLLHLHLVSHPISNFLTLHSTTLLRHLLTTRYPHLSRSFWLPFPLSHPTITSPAARTLRHATWQSKLTIHKAPYTTHIPPPAPEEICSCISCLLAWNNLALALDYTFFARTRLQRREPLPIIPRGKKEDWNEQLLNRHKEILRKAVLEREGKGGLVYAVLLQRYLEVLTTALTREIRAKGKDGRIYTRAAVEPKKAFFITAEDVRGQDDGFLARKGPESFEFPFSRDKYYEIDAYVPGRKWVRRTRDDGLGGEGNNGNDDGAAAGRWWYPDPEKVHGNDVAWIVGRFGDAVKDEAVAVENGA